MDLAPHVNGLSRALASAATAGGEEAEQFLGRFAPPLESAIRLALLNVLSAAADEITAELAPGSVDLRLRAGEPQFVVATPAPAPPEPAPEPPPVDEPRPASEPPVDEAATARISLRLSERLKAGVDEAAARENLSVNTWLVRVIAGALEPDPPRRAPRGRGFQVGESYVGWSH
jgi:hypothetical protein